MSSDGLENVIWGSLCYLPSSWPQARVEPRVGAALDNSNSWNLDDLDNLDNHGQSSRSNILAYENNAFAPLSRNIITEIHEYFISKPNSL